MARIGTIRTIVFWLHLSVASAAGAVVFMLAATGVVLSLEETALGLAEGRWRVEVQDGSARLPPEAIVQAAGLAATSLHYSSDPRSAVRVYEGRDRYARVDPYTGRVLELGPGALEAFFEDVRGWHRWLNLSGGSIRTGRAVTGAVNAAFLVLLLTGPILWIPRPISRRSLAGVLFLRPGARGARRRLNWHQVVGIWSVLPLAVIAVTGVTTSYPSVADRLDPVVGRAIPVEAWPARVYGAEDPGALDGTGASFPDADLGAVLTTAEKWASGWRILILNLPRPGDREVRVEVRTGRAGQPHKTGWLTVDAATGDVHDWESFADDPPARRARQFLRYAHTGEFWGLGGQWLAGLFSLAATLMVWTGLSLALRRARRFVRSRPNLRRKRVSPGSS